MAAQDFLTCRTFLFCVYILNVILSGSCLVCFIDNFQKLKPARYLNLATPSPVSSCSVRSVQRPPGSVPFHPFSSSDFCSSGCSPGTTADSFGPCCSSSHQVHWDPAGPVLKTGLWGKKCCTERFHWVGCQYTVESTRWRVLFLVAYNKQYPRLKTLTLGFKGYSQ